MMKYYLFPNYAEDKSAVIIKAHHCFGDGLALCSIFLAMSNEFDSKNLPSLKPLTLCRKFLLWISSPYLTLATMVRALFLTRENNNILQNKLPKSGIRTGGVSHDLDITAMKKFCQTRGCSINDYCAAVLSLVMHEYLTLNPIDDKSARLLPQDEYINVGLPFSLRQPKKKLKDLKIGNEFASVQSELVLTDDFEKALAYQINHYNMLKRTPSRTFGPMYAGGLTMNLPFLLPKFVMGDLTRKYSLVFTNVNASKIKYNWNGKLCSRFFVMANGVHQVYTCVNILTIGGEMSVAINSDKACIEDPQALCDLFAKKNRAILE